MRPRHLAATVALLDIVLVGAGACGCTSEGGHAVRTAADAHVAVPTADATPAEIPESDATIMPAVTFPESGARVTVALARSPEEQRRGLMYVQHLPVDAGMIFLFTSDVDHTFWMHNTLIPLDMIFIRKDLTVAGIVAKAEPLTETPRSVGERSRYVLEVNGGWAAAHGVVKGSKVQLEGFTP